MALLLPVVHEPDMPVIRTRAALLTVPGLPGLLLIVAWHMRTSDCAWSMTLPMSYLEACWRRWWYMNQLAKFFSSWSTVHVAVVPLTVQSVRVEARVNEDGQVAPVEQPLVRIS